mgnify:CR=1 FL=1
MENVFQRKCYLHYQYVQILYIHKIRETIWWSQYLPGKSKDFFRASLLEDSLGGGNGAIGLEILCGPSRLILSKRDEYKMLIWSLRLQSRVRTSFNRFKQFQTRYDKFRIWTISDKFLTSLKDQSSGLEGLFNFQVHEAEEPW